MVFGWSRKDAHALLIQFINALSIVRHACEKLSKQEMLLLVEMISPLFIVQHKTPPPFHKFVLKCSIDWSRT